MQSVFPIPFAVGSSYHPFLSSCLAALGLSRREWALAAAAASRAALHCGARALPGGFSCRSAWAPLRLQNLAGPGIQLVCPALAGGFCSMYHQAGPASDV